MISSRSVGRIPDSHQGIAISLSYLSHTNKLAHTHTDIHTLILYENPIHAHELAMTFNTQFRVTACLFEHIVFKKRSMYSWPYRFIDCMNVQKSAYSA